MKISNRDVTYETGIADDPNAGRAIRMRIGGFTYLATVDEALDLATQLADAVSRHKERTQQ